MAENKQKQTNVNTKKKITSKKNLTKNTVNTDKKSNRNSTKKIQKDRWLQATVKQKAKYQKAR